jgi:hypothetical protein
VEDKSSQNFPSCYRYLVVAADSEATRILDEEDHVAITTSRLFLFATGASKAWWVYQTNVLMMELCSGASIPELPIEWDVLPLMLITYHYCLATTLR